MCGVAAIVGALVYVSNRNLISGLAVAAIYLVCMTVSMLISRRAAEERAPEPGWHADPQGADLIPWWNGHEWTDERRPGSPSL